MSDPIPFDPNDPRAYTLDCRPWPEAQSPFAWFAARIKASRYPDEATALKMADQRRYLLALAEKLPRMVTRDPLFAVVIVRMAMSWPERSALVNIAAEIDKVVTAMTATNGNGNGHAPPPAPPPQGFAIPD